MRGATCVLAIVAHLAACKPQPPQPPGSGASANEPLTDLPMNDLPMNGLTDQALHNNQALIAAVVRQPLTPDLFSHGELASQLDKPYAVDLLQYMVACALDEGRTIALPATRNSKDREVKALGGELGLCDQRYNTWANGGASAFSWATQAPYTAAGRPSPEGQACLERVSACMLARVNAIGSEVRISMRGEAMTELPQVSVATRFRENHGTPIVSFEPGACSYDNPKSNCGWAPHFVGRCDAGTHVTITGNVDNEPVELRVCEGTYGCDHPKGVSQTGAPPTAPPRYAGLLPPEPGGDRKGTVTFICPWNGPMVPLDVPMVDAQKTGYFSVMYRTQQRRDPEIRATTPGTVYPAGESEVFTYYEGTFYGFIFGDVDVTESVERSLVGDQFACHSNVWTEQAAVYSDRLCAGPTDATPFGCFTNLPGRCEAGAAPTSCAHPPCLAAKRVPGRCDYDDDPRPAARSCRDGDTSTVPAATRLAGTPLRTWNHPYTTYLNHPCDLHGTDDNCLQHLAPPYRDLIKQQLDEAAVRRRAREQALTPSPRAVPPLARPVPVPRPTPLVTPVP